ncbi:MAG: NCS2 family permease [Spirulina sp. SIO3F2]|nr:NCS2 family permease [Spirulina sp. SIO3F2]
MTADLRPPSPNRPRFIAAIAEYFNFAAVQTTFRTEAIAGCTTFFTMAYILVVNPAILSNAIFLEEAGDLFGELAIATALAAAIATLVMALGAKYPFALAPGMGLNAYFAFSVVLGLGVAWPVALAAVFIEGLLFMVLSVTKVRSQLVALIPEGLKQATAGGIGLFIAYIALAGNPETGGAGLIVASEATMTTLGELGHPHTLMAIAGILLTSALLARRLPGALLVGILATAILSWILGIAPPPEAIVALPPLPVHLWGQAIQGLGAMGAMNWGELVAIVLAFLFVDLFDTVGTLTGLGMKAGYINPQGQLPRANAAFMADAVGTTAGALLGTSTVTSYIESAAGITAGGRTGFTALTTAGLFGLALFFTPLLAAVPGFATAPALVLVGVLMMGAVRQIRWDDPAEAIPAFLTLIVMPLSASIADGLAVGLITYPVLKTFQGKFSEVKGGLWAIAVLFVVKFVWF